MSEKHSPFLPDEDDPRLSAFLLGESASEREAQEVSQAVLSDAGYAEFARDIEAMILRLKEGGEAIKAVPSAVDVLAIEQALEADRVTPAPVPRLQPVGHSVFLKLSLSLAALLLLGFGLFWALGQGSPEEARPSLAGDVSEKLDKPDVSVPEQPESESMPVVRLAELDPVDQELENSLLSAPEERLEVEPPEAVLANRAGGSLEPTVQADPVKLTSAMTELTNLEGKTIRVQVLLVDVAANRVEIASAEHGRDYRLPIESLQKENRDWLREWAARQGPKTRVWTHRSGHRVTADLVEHVGENVRLLRLYDGQELKLSLRDLSEADQTYLGVDSSEEEASRLFDEVVTTTFRMTGEIEWGVPNYPNFAYVPQGHLRVFELEGAASSRKRGRLVAELPVHYKLNGYSLQAEFESAVIEATTAQGLEVEAAIQLQPNDGDPAVWIYEDRRIISPQIVDGRLKVRRLKAKAKLP